MLADLPSDVRLQGGRGVEHKILDQLRQKGIKIEPPSSREDVIDKIDGWWIGRDGNKKFGLQVKFRQSGDDILFELIRDIDRKQLGRDMKGSAQLYLVADRSGHTRLYTTKPIKEKAQELIDTFQHEFGADPFRTKWYGNGWEMKVQVDRAEGHRKLVAYFSPNLFEPIAEWDLNIYE